MFEVHAAFESATEISKQQYSFTIYTKSEHNRTKWLKLDIKAVVLPIKVDLIIDRDTLKKLDLIRQFPSHFASGNLLKMLQDLPPSLKAARDQKKRAAESRAEEPDSDDEYKDAQSKDTKSSPIPTESTMATPMENRPTPSKQLMGDPHIRQATTATEEVITSEAAEESLPSLWHIYATRRSAKKRRQFINNINQCTTAHRRKFPTPKGSAPEPLQPEVFKTYLNSLSLEPARWLQAEENSKEDRPFHAYCYALASNKSLKSAYEREGGLPGLPENKLESIPSELLERIQAIGEELEKIDIQGHPQIRARLIALVEEFKDVFSSSVVKEPANVTPFSLVIDEEKWQLPMNRGRGRPTDREREHELQRLLRVLVEFDVIEPCSESHWSHAFLVPKAKAGVGHGD
jgi:hypothetical protein